MSPSRPLANSGPSSRVTCQMLRAKGSSRACAEAPSGWSWVARGVRTASFGQSIDRHPLPGASDATSVLHDVTLDEVFASVARVLDALVSTFVRDDLTAKLVREECLPSEVPHLPEHLVRALHG